MSAVTPFPEVADAVMEAGGSTMLTCMHCGTCTAVCPWSAIREFSPRLLMRRAALGLEGFEGEELWSCVTCNTCVSRCPRGIGIVDAMRSMRAVISSMGSPPAAHAGPLASLRTDGNPWSGDRSDRAAWQDGLGIPGFGPATDWLFFTCCTQAYDARNRKVAKALVRLLQAAGISFGSLGTAENCCGDQPSKAGAAEVFEQLRDANTALLNERGVERMIVASPHCLDAFRRYYPELGAREAVEHHSVLLAKLVREGRLRPGKEVRRRVTYHDPCYLGRHNGVYEPPRELLRSIPGLELLEMVRNRETALCCGAGGGGVWSEIPVEERFATLRVREARETGADTLAVACPYCMVMFEDAVKVLGLADEIAVADVAELLAESVFGEA